MPSTSRLLVPLTLAAAAGLMVAATVDSRTATGVQRALDAQAASARAFTGNPVEGSRGFGVVVEEDAVLVGTESEGPVAIGGDLRFGPGYNVSLSDAGSFTVADDAQPTALLVGGKIDLGGSSPNGVLKVLSHGYVKIGDLAGSRPLAVDGNGARVNTHVVPAGAAYDAVPRIELARHQPADSVGPAPGLIDFTSLFATYRTRAEAMATCPTNVTMLDGNGTAYPDQQNLPPGSAVKLALRSGVTNVLHLTGAQLNNIAELQVLAQPTPTAPLLIVVDTTATRGVFTWNTPNMPALDKTSIGSVLWDFPDATDITIASGDTLEGTIYAPRAHLRDLDPSNTEGDIIVRSLEEGTAAGIAGAETSHSAGEVHYFPFEAKVSCMDTPVTPTATPTTTAPTSAAPTSAAPTTAAPTTTAPPTTAAPSTTPPTTSVRPTTAKPRPTWSSSRTAKPSRQPATTVPAPVWPAATHSTPTGGSGHLAHSGASDLTRVLAVTGAALLVVGASVMALARRRR
ncbi:choice-of-anchor A family protein [Streptodolium elevatio]|uniref:Choice-of-anchor A family protein n=1 Tax=Streptodolium elevatio TaxID=3157996 RepID=A0ABV3DAW9_9ACTN